MVSQNASMPAFNMCAQWHCWAQAGQQLPQREEAMPGLALDSQEGDDAAAAQSTVTLDSSTGSSVHLALAMLAGWLHASRTSAASILRAVSFGLVA